MICNMPVSPLCGESTYVLSSEEVKHYLSPPQKETMDSLWYGTCHYMQGLYFYGRYCAELILQVPVAKNSIQSLVIPKIEITCPREIPCVLLPKVSDLIIPAPSHFKLIKHQEICCGFKVNAPPEGLTVFSLYKFPCLVAAYKLP